MTELTTSQPTSTETGAPASGGAVPDGGQPAATPPAASATPPVSDAASTADWRDLMAGGDADARKQLDRFTDPGAFFKSYTEAQRTLRESGRVKVPGENATPEEIAAWNKARGVPEKPDGYQITVKPPAGVELGENDKAMLTGLTAELHKLGAEPRMVEFAHQFYFGQIAEAAAQRMAAAEAFAEQAEAQLRHEFGRDYESNIGWANAAIDQFGLKDMLNTRLEDGSLLGDNPVLVKAMAKIGRLNAEDPFFQRSANGGTGQTPEARKAEIMALRNTNPAEYDRLQGELERINTALARRMELHG